MGIQLQDIDESNILQVIRLYQTANILKWIPAKLVNAENCLVAVEVNGLALKYVPRRLTTTEIMLAAIQQNHQSLWVLPKSMMIPSLINAAVNSFMKQCQAARYFSF